MRLILAIKAFFAILFGRRLSAKAAARLLPGAGQAEQPKAEQPKQKAAPAAPAGDGAVQLLALLQREGRLVDFLEEDLGAFGDAQVGAAVRDIHRGCRKVLSEHFALEPVMPGQENQPVRVDRGFDQAAIRLVGNVTGEPPYSGALRHHGWRVTRVTLPNEAGALLTQPAIVAPAEVELS
jgi:hypothetical protein